MTAQDLLDPKNDFVFKKLFADAPQLLVALINAVRSAEEPITEVQVINPRIDPQELAGKFIVLDILATDAIGRRYNIEMQVRRHDPWSARSAYYLARTLSQQIQGGENYQAIKPAIGIHLLDFDLFDTPAQAKQALWCFEMRDRQSPGVRLGDELELNIIELKKADRLGVATQALAAWVALFEHWKEEATMSQIAYAPVQEALERIKALSADEETRQFAFVRERAMRDEASALRAERETGMLEGEIKGKIEGEIKGKSEQLAHLLTKRFGPLTDATSTRLANATLEQLETWFDRAIDAPTLAAVFDGH